MSAHTARPGSRPRRSAHLATLAAAAIALLAAACTGTAARTMLQQITGPTGTHLLN